VRARDRAGDRQRGAGTVAAVIGEPISACAARLQLHLARLWTIDPHSDLLCLGRWALDDAGRTVTKGLVHPGFSYCTFGYLLSAAGLRKVLGCGFERALIPVDELLPALYLDHPREDIRSLYPKRLRAYALSPLSLRNCPRTKPEVTRRQVPS
jgi:hypothetical protein